MRNRNELRGGLLRGGKAANWEGDVVCHWGVGERKGEKRGRTRDKKKRVRETETGGKVGGRLMVRARERRKNGRMGERKEMA